MHLKLRLHHSSMHLNNQEPLIQKYYDLSRLYKIMLLTSLYMMLLPVVHSPLMTNPSSPND